MLLSVPGNVFFKFILFNRFFFEKIETSLLQCQNPTGPKQERLSGSLI